MTNSTIFTPQETTISTIFVTFAKKNRRPKMKIKSYCPSCHGKRYYEIKKSANITCPKCGTMYGVEIIETTKPKLKDQKGVVNWQ
jgi:uncharacterized Zn-finger protein